MTPDPDTGYSWLVNPRRIDALRQQDHNAGAEVVVSCSGGCVRPMRAHQPGLQASTAHASRAPLTEKSSEGQRRRPVSPGAVLRMA